MKEIGSINNRTLELICKVAWKTSNTSANNLNRVIWYLGMVAFYVSLLGARWLITYPCCNWCIRSNFPHWMSPILSKIWLSRLINTLKLLVFPACRQIKQKRRTKTTTLFSLTHFCLLPRIVSLLWGNCNIFGLQAYLKERKFSVSQCWLLWIVC